MTRSLERLLRPQSIAIFGGREARRVVEQCDRMGYAGAIWPVHPSRDKVAGRPCFRSVDDLPGAPDAAFIGVNRHLTIEIVRALSRRGTGGAVCYASGFGEAAALGDAAETQAALVAAAGDMPIIGPNCYGLINAIDGALLWPDQHGLTHVEGGVAILTQSSNIAINMTMQMRGLPIAYVLTAGNQAQTGLADLAAGVIADSRVTTIGLHIEGFGDIAALERLAARARELRKPIVALKVGRSEAARRATVSHTASLAGDDAVSGAVLTRLGIGRARSIPELIETLKILHVYGPLAGYDVASMSCSGGEASLMADAAESRCVRFRALTEDQAKPLAAELGPMVTVANPLDYHTFIWADRARMASVFSGMMAAKFALTMLVLDFPRADRCDGADWDHAVEALKDAATKTGAPAAIVSTFAETLPEDVSLDLIEAGIVPLCGFDEALAAAEIAADIGAAWAEGPAAPMLARGTAAGPARVLDEAQSKKLLAAYGLAIPAGEIVEDQDAACRAAARLRFPVVLKALGIAHKSEAGAVAIGLADEAELREAFTRMSPLAGRFLVERMAPEPVAELIIGVARDAVAGPVMTIGAGGILVELIRDSAVLTLPTTREAVVAALQGLAVWKLLAGYRGRPEGDIEALAEAALAVGRFVTDNAARIEELDINPLFVLPEGEGVVAVDALISMRGEMR